MKITDLIPGATYMVRHEDPDFPEEDYTGLAVYEGLADELEFVPGTLIMRPVPSNGEELFLGIEAVRPPTQHQGAVIEQLEELHRVATKLKLYDAADWLRPRMETTDEIIERYQELKRVLDLFGILFNTPPLITDKAEWELACKDAVEQMCAVLARCKPKPL